MWLWSLWPANRVTCCDTIIFRWTLGRGGSDDDDVMMMMVKIIMTIMIIDNDDYFQMVNTHCESVTVKNTFAKYDAFKKNCKIWSNLNDFYTEYSRKYFF